jgi:NitT/TauT family transport system substrate-binding protein
MADIGQLGRRHFLGLAGAGAGAAALGLLAGCGEGGSGSQGASASGTTAIKAVGAASGSAGVMRQALKLAATQMKLAEVEIADMSQGTALLSMRNKSATCAMMSWVNLAQAKDQRVEAWAIAPAWASHASILVPTDSPYQSLADLKGKKMGSAQRTTGVYTETRAVLKAQGIDIEKDYKLQPMGDSTVMVALYKKGDFDAILDNEPIVSQLLAEGSSRELLQVGAYQAQHNAGRFSPVNSWGVRKEWLEQQDGKKMKELFSRASVLAKTSKEPYVLAAKSSGLDEKSTDLFFERFSKLVVPEFTQENLQDAQKLLDDAHGLGLVKTKFQVTDFVYQG